MKKSIFIILTAVLLIFLTCHLAIADEKISPITATASSYYYSGYQSSYAVDGNLSTKWVGKHYKDPWWIKFDTGKVHSISKVVTYWYKYGYAAGDYDIQISTDDANWINVYTGLSGVYGPNGDVREINQDARYIMFKIYSTQGPPIPAMEEFEAYKSDGPVNEPPTAQAGADPISGYATLMVDFTGSGSDSDGTVVSYHWTFGTFMTSNHQNPSYFYTTPGTYVATLTVTDNGGATGTDSVTITVNEPANQPPTARASADRTSGDAPFDVRFTGGASSDPDGIIVSYHWDFGDGETLNAENPPIHTYQNPGRYIAALTVIDDDGATNFTSVTIMVTVPFGGGVPHLIRFQGNLADAEGVLLDDIFTLTFVLYDVEIDGMPLWEEVQENVHVEGGFLDVELGSVMPLELPFDKQYWLGVEVELDGEMMPRFKLTTVPYSFVSEN